MERGKSLEDETLDVLRATADGKGVDGHALALCGDLGGDSARPRLFIVSAVAGLPDTQPTLTRLLRNQALHMADALSAGIISRFPRAFR